MRFVLMALLFSLASVAIAQPPQYPSLPQYPTFAEPDLEESPYKAVTLQALREGKDVILYVGVTPKEVAGTMPLYRATHEWGKGVYRLQPKADGWLYERQVSLPATPFVRKSGNSSLRQGSRPGELRPIADDDTNGRGPWPTSLPFPEGAERYMPAKVTQSIYTLNNSPAIDRVDRRQLKAETFVPGGMESVQGWRSDLYRYVPPGWQRSWRARMPVVNSFGATQYELGWTRAYPDGTYFIDALSNSEGEPFEIRMREKIGGRWQSYIAWKNIDARPTGYHGLNRSCASCHEQAGTGGYAVGLWPGGDTVLSDPLEGLE